MKKSWFMTSLLLCSVLAVLNSCKPKLVYDVPEVIRLDEGWHFQMEGDEDWLPASVPGCVHTDLLENKKISDPFYRNNEKQLQWIDKKNWLYKCEFTLDSLKLKHNKILLRFQGLDTYASVKLNGEAILNADNMFRTWTVDIKQYLKSGSNTLEILFASPILTGLEKLEEHSYGLPASNDQSEVGGLEDKKVSVFTRKAPYHFGWDWGPRFVTSGVWRPVELFFFNQAQIENVYYQQSLVNKNEATIDAIIDINAFVAGEYQLSIYQDAEEMPFITSNISIEEGLNSITLPFTIMEPELWWPNGLGEQHQYKLDVRLSMFDVIIDTFSQKLGVRSIELVREPDSTGTSFYFSVNGKPVFAKGANYIPNDNFLNRVSDEKYEKVIRSAVEANMNMLRVWGGGIYENDIFYDLCDKYGIMVWQDFMFACSMYPGDDAFLSNVRSEAVDNVKRLQNHASIALWCGNNEIDAAWCEGNMFCGWGWKQRYSKKQREDIWHAYDTLFHKILPEVIEIYDPVRAYWPSSPQADWGEHASYKSMDKGDVHYWGVWHGNRPFSDYYKVIGRFMSEYGFQSLPDMQSVKKFTLPSDWDFESEVLLSHQRSGYGNSRIIDYMEKLYPVPEDFSQLLYVGQIMQAEAIKSAILAHRANKPHCMGSLYWQLNDCWPSASWSSMDYYTSWKALQYYAKKAYAPVAISFFPDNDQIRIILASDLDKPKVVTVRSTLTNFEGSKLREETIETILDPDRSVEIAALSEKEIRKEFDAENLYLLVEIIKQEEILVADHYFFDAPKNLKLPEAKVSLSTKLIDGQLRIELSADKLVKNLYLWTEKSRSRFSDNYFDLLPGEKVTITMDLAENETVEAEDIQMISLNEIMNAK